MKTINQDGTNGEYIPAGGPGGLEDHHAHESNAVTLIGQDPAIEELTPDWTVTRLMREATDYGKRSRQTARVSALTTLAKMQGLLDDGALDDIRKAPLQRALDMPHEERMELIIRKAKEMGISLKAADDD